ncbi:hypothetical protein [Nocardia anaemiae]|uniref:hypothetical protein n=1 Tax=Nocardia anaemiae TaxID=263910 RepID=UPI0007A42D2E|nr:hypothetical protein [Nocardia anaemiae]
MTPCDPVDWTCFSIHTEISGPVVGDYRDPGMLPWSGHAIYTVTGGSGTDPQHSDQALGLSVSRTDDEGEPRSEWTVLTMHGLIVDPFIVEDSILRLLDELSADYDHFRVLFDGNDFHPELMDMIDGGLGSRAVLIDRARVAPAWRGMGGVGRLLISRILRLFADTAGVVATNPFPIDLFAEWDTRTGLVKHPRFGDELAKVQRTWGSLGFQPYKDPIWVMDPAMSTHSRAVAELEKQLAAEPARSQ